jgi:CRISPR type I-E-associated protein CasB/Cse2
MSPYLLPLSQQATAAAIWWRTLEANAVGRSRLRRAHWPLQVLLYPESLTLISKMGWVPTQPDADRRARRIAAIAATLSHVRELSPVRIGEAISEVGGKSRHPISEARFRRLMEVRGTTELMSAMTRLVKSMDGKVNVSDLTVSMLSWSDEVRARWTFDYYGMDPSEASIADLPNFQPKLPDQAGGPSKSGGAGTA